METTVGDILIECHREWSPLGADRFYNLCMIGYFDDVRFHRVVPNFVAQFGYQGDPAANKAWSAATIKDDTVTAGKLQSNVRGTVTFAKATAPHTRSTQVFINFADNLQLDPPHYMGFSPFGKVLEGMDQLKNLHSGYGERVNEDPQSRQGNAHIAVAYPELGFIKKAVVLRKVTK
jgi:cyclophilin family peptidyl-prolyl cis-trans isomerase